MTSSLLNDGALPLSEQKQINTQSNRIEMKRSLSVTTGKGSLNHNDRKFTAQNVDTERTKTT